MDSCKLVFNEEPMDYLKFEELSNNLRYRQRSAPRHITLPLPLSLRTACDTPDFATKDDSEKDQNLGIDPKMTLDPRLQICWQIFFAVKLSASVYEMTS